MGRWRGLTLVSVLLLVSYTSVLPHPLADGAFPWELSREVVPRLPWEDLQDDLDGILRIQARDNTVSILVFNEGFYAVTLNALVSMIKFGGLDNLIVAAAGASSVARCKALRLPCYDTSHLMKVHGGTDATDEDTVRNSPEWFQLVWVKTLIAHAAIHRGYNVLFADADTVFLKEALPVYRRYLEDNKADATFMYEEANQTREDGTPYLNRYLNSGNFYMLSNERTKKLMEMWMLGYRFQSHSNGNQLWLNKLDRLGYKICYSPGQCKQHAQQGWAAIRPHPNQYDGVGQMCTPDRLVGGPCSDRRLYVHAICRAGHHLKRQAFEKLGLWFVRFDPQQPSRVTVDIPALSPLPCGGSTWAGNYKALKSVAPSSPAPSQAVAAPYPEAATPSSTSGVASTPYAAATTATRPVITTRLHLRTKRAAF